MANEISIILKDTFEAPDSSTGIVIDAEWASLLGQGFGVNAFGMEPFGS